MSSGGLVVVPRSVLVAFQRWVCCKSQFSGFKTLGQLVFGNLRGIAWPKIGTGLGGIWWNRVSGFLFFWFLYSRVTVHHVLSWFSCRLVAALGAWCQSICQVMVKPYYRLAQYCFVFVQDYQERLSIHRELEKILIGILTNEAQWYWWANLWQRFAAKL